MITLLKILALLPSVLGALLDVIREVKQRGERVERRDVKVAVTQGLQEHAVHKRPEKL